METNAFAVEHTKELLNRVKSFIERHNEANNIPKTTIMTVHDIKAYDFTSRAKQLEQIVEMKHDYPILVIEKVGEDGKAVVVNQEHQFQSIEEFMSALKE